MATASYCRQMSAPSRAALLLRFQARDCFSEAGHAGGREPRPGSFHSAAKAWIMWGAFAIDQERYEIWFTGSGAHRQSRLTANGAGFSGAAAVQLAGRRSRMRAGIDRIVRMAAGH